MEITSTLFNILPVQNAQECNNKQTFVVFVAGFSYTAGLQLHNYFIQFLFY